MGAPASSATTAGTGTGSSPWAARTVPVPSATALDATSSTPRTSRAAQVPTMSTMASSAPTSWRCTEAAGMRCSRPSASASARTVARARRCTRSGRPASAMILATSAAWRCGGSGSVCTWTFVAPMPERVTVSVSSDHPPTGRRRSRARTSSTSAPASIRAPRAMSPAMPEKQWNQATVAPSVSPAPSAEGAVTSSQATGTSSPSVLPPRGVACGRGQARASAPRAASPGDSNATGPSARSTAQAAPKPLSIPTTVRPDAHDASMPSRAVTPASPAP